MARTTASPGDRADTPAASRRARAGPLGPPDHAPAAAGPRSSRAIWRRIRLDPRNGRGRLDHRGRWRGRATPCARRPVRAQAARAHAAPGRVEGRRLQRRHIRRGRAEHRAASAGCRCLSAFGRRQRRHARRCGGEVCRQRRRPRGDAAQSLARSDDPVRRHPATRHVSRPALAARRTARRAGTPPAGGGMRNAVRREGALFRISGIAAGRRVRTRRVPPGGGCLRRMGRVAARPVAQPASVGGLLDWCRISIATSVTIVIGSTNPSMIAENFGNRSWPRASSTRYAT